MLKNYLKVAHRSLARNPFFTVINVLGLSVGMSISVLILTIITDLLSFDQFHENKENIYRITSTVNYNTRENDWATTPVPLAAELQFDLPDLGEITRINRHLSYQVEQGQKFIPLRGHYVDTNFFNVFSFPFLAGDSLTALSKPFT